MHWPGYVRFDWLKHDIRRVAVRPSSVVGGRDSSSIRDGVLSEKEARAARAEYRSEREKRVCELEKIHASRDEHGQRKGD
jgi:hypothetical protein